MLYGISRSHSTFNVINYKYKHILEIYNFEKIYIYNFAKK